MILAAVRQLQHPAVLGLPSPALAGRPRPDPADRSRGQAPVQPAHPHCPEPHAPPAMGLVETLTPGPRPAPTQGSSRDEISTVALLWS
jgi:hypothetical protein